MAKKLVVGLIFGGRSGEHEVSLVSARGIMAALGREKYQVIPIGIARDGHWLIEGDPLTRLEALSDTPDSPTHPQATSTLAAIWPEGFPRVDVVFPVLHGPYGEDGTIQGLCELAGLPYVGAGVLASALAMDKIASKMVARAAGLPIVDYISLSRKRWQAQPETVIAEIERRLGYPCFVKPANLGSSVGITKASEGEELWAGLDLAATYDRRLLIERAVDAREIEVSVLGNDEPIASVPGEILPSREFYDYDAKYVDDRSELLIPAPLPEELASEIRELAVKAYKAHDGAGMARVDFLLERDTMHPYLNELNTIPGFTPISMYPKLWDATGLPYPKLLDRLIELALERFADRRSDRVTR